MSDDKYVKLQKWLYDNSSELHQPSAPGSGFPTRLLSIDLKSEHPTLQLVRTANILISHPDQFGLYTIQYLALSHRWGQSRHHVTTKANLEDRYSQICYEILPSTYQDAIIITRRLGVPFLWIDALCIVQDDELEWFHESAIVGDIFRNAFCTIAAHFATNDSQGFLQSSLGVAESIWIRDDSQGQPTSNNVLSVSLGWTTKNDTDASPLSKRGWVLQERLLSRRIMHFVQGRVLWETVDSSPIISNDGRKDWSNKAGMRGELLMPLANHTQAGTPFFWFGTIEYYASRDLTEDKDKLIAISGLAKHIQDNTGIGYYAGLWADCMADGLLWLTKGQRLKSPSAARAPSWSWASLDGPVQFPWLYVTSLTAKLVTLLEILDFAITIQVFRLVEWR